MAKTLPKTLQGGGVFLAGKVDWEMARHDYLLAEQLRG